MSDTLIHTQVFLVGAGPGDPDLFTLKMIQVRQTADIVLYDYLVHPNFQKYCSERTELICVGKKKGAHSTQQSQINEMMVDFAMQKKCVVRLKGGDPLLFGRGGEEMAFLSQKNISYEVIPGISSAVAVPAYAGICLTHRNYSRSVAFVTGTTQSGELISDKDYPEADTLVFLMAMSHLKELSDRLQSHKRFSEETPATVIQDGTLSSQRLVTGTLGRIATQVKEEEITHPALLIVGDVAKLTSTLAWRHQLPLSGKRIWVCRPQSRPQTHQHEWGAALSLLGAEVIHAPLIKIQPIQSALDQITPPYLSPFTMVLFTSSNAVTHFFKALLQSGGDSRCLSKKLIGVVGPKTAEALHQYGIIADIQPSTYSATGLLNKLPELTHHHILVPQAKKASPQLVKELRQKGAQVDQVSLYDTDPIPPPQGVVLKDGDTVILISSSQVDSFSKIYSGEKISCVVTSQSLVTRVNQYYSGELKCAQASTIDGVISAILGECKKK